MNIVLYTLRSICGAILFPPSIFVLLTLLAVFYFKNKKRAAMQKVMVGDSVESALELTLSQFVFGVFGGIIGSIILNLCGVTFNENCRIEVLFITSIILMALKPSFVCFSYSASVLGLISIMLKVTAMIMPNADYTYILNLDILYVMIFVGVMHVVEGILVFLDGHRGAFPIIIKRENEVIGGYSLKRHWILPLSIMVIGNMGNVYGQYNSIQLSEIPYYWSSFKSQGQIDLLNTSLLCLFSFYAVSGYSSVTYTRSKREKAVSSAVYIFSYGMLLILAAQTARIGISGEIFVVIFAPAAHELMLKLQKKSEMKRQPKFISNKHGLVVLEVGRDTRLKESGIKVNSRIISVNNEYIKSEKDIYTILKRNLHKGVIKIENHDGVIKDIDYVHDNKRIGALLVPLPEEDDSYKKEKAIERFKDVLNNINNKTSDK